MITREELITQADAFDLNDADVQRDYMFGWIIGGLFNTSKLATTAVLKGGNALRKAHLPATRFSDDLDFSVPHELNPEGVLGELNEVCRYASAGSGIEFDIDRNRLAGEHQIDTSRRVYKYRLYFKDAISGRDHVQLALRVDMTQWDRLHLEPQTQPLIHPYSDADACAATVTCVALEEALADKMKCLLQRRYCYDLFDLAYGAFADHGIPVDRSLLLQVFLAKTLFSRSPAAARSLLLDLPLDTFRGFWSKVLTPTLSRMSFDSAIEILTRGIEGLFAGFSDLYGTQRAFYPSHLRNLILEAGVGRRRMRMTYKGVPRIVEPYSLIFKTRKSDGVGQEYLFVYDCTGGRSRPGIKSLLHGQINNLEVLDDTFEPRYEVTLAKAGDTTQAGVFTGNRGYRRAGASKSRSTSRGNTRYTVKCNLCDRTFRRTTATTSLRAHKDRNGYPCRSRSGYRLS